MSTRQGICFSRAAISMNLSHASASPRLMPRVARRVPLLLSSVHLRVVIHMRVATAFHTAREQWHTPSVMRGDAQVPKGRRWVAGGASPRTTISPNGKAPEGRQAAASMGWASPIIQQTCVVMFGQALPCFHFGFSVAPLGLGCQAVHVPGAAPLATNLGSSGAGT